MPAEIPHNIEISLPHLDYFAPLHGTSSNFEGLIAWETNSGAYRRVWNGSAEDNTFIGIRQFIKLEESFLSQLEENEHEIFVGKNRYSLREKMKISADAILKFSPEKISLELTSEGSIFYKMIKGEFKIFIEHYLIDEYDGKDEALMTIFHHDTNILSYAGELDEVINQLSLFYNSPSNIIAEPA